MAGWGEREVAAVWCWRSVRPEATRGGVSKELDGLAQSRGCLLSGRERRASPRWRGQP